MTTATVSDGERLSRLEGAYEHLATKADVERVRADLERVRADLKTDMQAMEARLLIRLGGIVSLGVAVIVAIQKLA